MSDIFKLTKQEFIKIFKHKLSWITLLILTIVMIALTANEKNDYSGYLELNQDIKNSEDKFWIEKEQFLIDSYDEYMNDSFYSPIQKEAIQKRVEIAKYKLENNMQRQMNKNKWYFFSDNTFKYVNILVVLLVSIVGVLSLAREYSDKTLTPLLLLPYKRYKILLAKYLSTLLYGLLSYSLIVILGFLSGIVVYDISSYTGSIILYGANGPYSMSLSTYSIIVVLLQLIPLIFYISLSFLIAVLCKSSSISVIITALSLTLIAPLNTFIVSYYNFTKYLPFVNTDFRKFLEFGSTLPAIESGFQSVVYDGITQLTAGIIITLYIALFTAITFISFCKSDVK